jgi:hypothetical protein
MCKEDKAFHDWIVWNVFVIRAHLEGVFRCLGYGIHVKVHKQGVTGIENYIWSDGNRPFGVAWAIRP